MMAMVSDTRSPEEIELDYKVSGIAKRRYGSWSRENMKRMFESFDREGKGYLTSDDVTRMLIEANVGNVLTRSFWVSAIMKRIDLDRDGRVNWNDYSRMAYGE